MSEQELQNDSLEPVENTEPQEIENHDNGAELAPASDGNHEQTPEVDEEAKKQAAIDKIIGEKTFKAKQAERERDELKQRLEAIETAKRESEAKQVANIPPMPTDEFDENYQRDLQAHIDGVKRQAQWEANQAVYTQQQEQIQQQQQIQQAQEFQQKVASYSESAKKLGVDSTELEVAANKLDQLGVNLNTTPHLVSSLLADQEGPLIVKYLAANPLESMQLAQMDPFTQAQYIERNVRTKLDVIKPKTSSAPKPAQDLSGGGADKDEGRYQHIKGAKFY